MENEKKNIWINCNYMAVLSKLIHFVVLYILANQRSNTLIITYIELKQSNYGKYKGTEDNFHFLNCFQQMINKEQIPVIIYKQNKIIITTN